MVSVNDPTSGIKASGTGSISDFHTVQVLTGVEGGVGGVVGYLFMD